MGGRSFTIVVPYPRPALGPNGRGVWQAKARLMHEAREAAGWMARAQLLRQVPLGGEDVAFPAGTRVLVDATVRPGRGRKRMDADNLWACLKPALDALTDVRIWADDRQAVLGTVTYADERVAGDGEVELRLSEAIAVRVRTPRGA
jgi:Holliday junction resolvase RusA-like endonuclease